MTVPVADQLEYITDANGVTKDFPYPKRFLQKDEIVVMLRDDDGVDTPQILNTHYTIAGSSWASGGTVSFNTAPASGLKVVLYRMTQAKQTVDLENNQRNDAPSVELQLDRLTMAIQDRGARTDAAWWGLLAEIAARVNGDKLLNDRVDQEIIDRILGDKALASLIGQAGSIAEHVFESNLALSMAEVKPTFHAILTLGGQTPKDGLGGLYVDEDNGSTETLTSGDGRTWYRVADVQAKRVVQSPAYTRMTSRILSDVLAGQPISPFHFGGNGLAIDQSNALQNALEFTLLDDTNPQSCTLDLVGRNWRTNKGLSIKEAPKTKRRITNGQITVIGGFSDSSVLEIATPTTTGGVDWVSALSIDNINFLGGSNKSSVLSQDVIVLENSHKIRITDCYFQWFNGRGIFDKTTRAAVDLIVKGCTIEGTYNTSEGIRTSGSDIELTKNIISNCNRGIVSLEHSVNVEFNHIYDCVDRSIFYNAQAALCVGNYIDGPGILIRGNRGVFSNNKFLRPNADNFPVTDAFITIQPIAPNTAIQGMVITNNNFANPAGGTVNMINVDTTNGNIGEVYRTTIEGNTGTAGVNYQRSHPEGRTQISAGTSGALDLSSQVPFGHIKHATVSWKKDAISSVIPAAAVTDISGADVVTVGLSQAATGLAYVRGDINEFI